MVFYSLLQWYTKQYKLKLSVICWLWWCRRYINSDAIKRVAVPSLWWDTADDQFNRSRLLGHGGGWTTAVGGAGDGAWRWHCGCCDRRRLTAIVTASAQRRLLHDPLWLPTPGSVSVRGRLQPTDVRRYLLDKVALFVDVEEALNRPSSYVQCFSASSRHRCPVSKLRIYKVASYKLNEQVIALTLSNTDRF